MHTMKQLREYAAAYELAVSDGQLEQFQRYLELLLLWNERMNLTAILDPEQIVIRHFLDSIVLLACADIPHGGSVIDIGTGAGFPGIPLKIMRPDLDLTLLDSLAKRIEFLYTVSEHLGQENRFFHLRAEAGGRDPALRDRFDLATARAVAALPALCEYCLPFVRPGGVFAALKGPDVEQEAAQAANAIAETGAVLRQIHTLTLPQDHRRSIVLMDKTAPTPPRYPRNSARIAKSPL